MEIEKEYELIIEKLADIRDTYFDNSDMEAEGHGMEDMIADPYSVLIYTENKLKRLIEKNKQLKEFIEGWEYDLTPEFRRHFPNGI
jgi:hypothetical protein